MLRLTKEASIGTTKFTIAPEWLSIEGEDEVSGAKAQFVIDREEATEIAAWLAYELLGQQWPKGSSPHYKATNAPAQVIEAECVYDPGDRKASQTVEMKVGDPNLGYSLGGAPVEVTDLGRLKGPVGHS